MLDPSVQIRHDGTMRIEDLAKLLLEFEECDRAGRPLPAERTLELARIVTDAIWDEYSVLGHDFLLVRDARTGRVRRRRRSELHDWSDLEAYENIRDSGDWLGRLVATLDRLLSRGVRRQASRGGACARPRLAERVAEILEDGKPLTDPQHVVAESVRYAIFDEWRSCLRRIRNGTQRRAAATPRARRHDGKSLVRNHCVARLLAIAPERRADLAYCLAFEYQRGGLDREALRAMQELALGDAPLAATLDAIDAAAERIDRDDRAQSPASTRRRSARVKGIGAEEFSAILKGVGLPLSPTSLSKLYGRKSKAIRKALDEVTP